jgi:hypothetical protein
MVILYILVTLLVVIVLLLSMALYYFVRKTIYFSDKEKEFITFVIDIFKDYGDDLGIQTKEEHKKLVEELNKVKKKLKLVIEQFPDENLLSADGFDDAIIGVAAIKQTAQFVLVYSRAKCIEILVERDEMSREEAEEYFDFNVEGAYVGEKTPIFVDDLLFFEC